MDGFRMSLFQQGILPNYNTRYIKIWFTKNLQDGWMNGQMDGLMDEQNRIEQNRIEQDRKLYLIMVIGWMDRKMDPSDKYM